MRAIDADVVRVGPPRRWPRLRLGEILRTRELLYFLVWRDIKVRYKQTALGELWAVLQPFITMVVFTIFFGKVAGVSSEGLPYPVFSFTALVPWTLFSTAVAQSAGSLVGSSNLITKAFFPRVIIPIAAIGGSMVDFLLASVMLVGFLIYYQIAPDVQAFAVVAFTFLAIVAVLGLGFWLSALNVRYRDVRYALPFLLQLWLFCTPIAYSARPLEGVWSALYGINPMASVAEGFRWALLDTPPPDPQLLATSIASTVLLLVSGFFYFRKVESTFADVI